MNKEKKSLKGLCRMCGSKLPKPYPAVRCWRCLRTIEEKEFCRYYVRTENSFWEEVQLIRGLCAFREENQPTIRKAIEKEKKSIKEREKNSCLSNY